MNPAFSILVPVHKYDSYFVQMINSMEKNFDNQDSECLLVLNGRAISFKSEIENLAKTYNSSIRVIEFPDKDLPSILNFGLNECKNEVIVRMDSDDIMCTNRAAKLATQLYLDKSLVLVYSNIRVIDSSGKTKRVLKFDLESDKIKERLRFGNTIPHPAVAFRKSDVLSAGGYRSLYPHAEDYDLWRRLESIGEFKCVNEILLGYRIHKNQISTAHLAVQDISTLDIVIDNEISKSNLVQEIDFAKDKVAVCSLRARIIANFGIQSTEGRFPNSKESLDVYAEVLIRRVLARYPSIGWQGIRFLILAAIINPNKIINRVVSLSRKH